MDAHIWQRHIHRRYEDAVVIRQHYFRRLVKGVGVPNLLRHPLATGVVRSAAHRKFTPIMVDDVQDVEQPAAPVEGYLEVHRCHCAAVILQERSPTLSALRCRRSSRFRLLALQNISDRRLRHLQAQLLGHYQADAFGAIAGVVGLDIDDDFLDRSINSGSTRCPPFASNYKHPPTVLNKAPVPAYQCRWPEIGVASKGGCNAV